MNWYTSFRAGPGCPAVFLCSTVWVLPWTRQFLPVHGVVTEYAGIVASICMTLSGAHMFVITVAAIHQRTSKWMRSQPRLARRALRRATPLEKLVLGIPVRLGEHRIRLDVGSPIAMHLQEIGLIRRATGLPRTEYWLAQGLADIGIKQPSLLRLSPKEESEARAEFEQWKRTGVHRGLFDQMAGPSEYSWMA